MYRYLRIFIVFSLLFTVIPMGVFLNFKKKTPLPTEKTSAVSSPDTVRILNNQGGSLSEIPLDEYLAGCVMAQIPCTFEPEALKAQAVIARTYILYQKAHSNTGNDGNSQKYFTPDQAESFYGESYNEAYEKALTAVKETDGIYLSYENAPIVTAFHPISCGFTESAEDIWGVEIPYLVSVESTADKDADGFEQTLEISQQEIFSRLCAFFEADPVGEFSLKIKEKTKNGTVISLEFSQNDAKKEVTATDLANLLGLNSCNFTISENDDYFLITCHGGGHLVGLSQWGANSMALEGKTFEEILTHYFQGVSLSHAQ